MTRNDERAMRLAIKMVRQEGPTSDRQIERMLARESFEKVGKFAAYSCQCRALNLRPWQYPPCWVDSDASYNTADDEDHGRPAAAMLLRQMLAAGVSRYRPDPIRALEDATVAKPAA